MFSARTLRLLLIPALSFASFLAPVALHAQQPPAAIISDPPADKANPAAMQTMQIPSHGAQLNALMYVAAGAGPHPTVILLHGFPGNERNLDLAQAIRRAGWNVLYFNYRGSWGSPGGFSFTHCTEDVASAIAWLRDPANAAKLRTDSRRIVLIGHSMGGFMAAYGTAHDPSILAVGMISAADFGGMASMMSKEGEAAGRKRLAAVLANEGMAPLAGTSADALSAETFAHQSEWDFVTYAPAFASRPVLLVTSDDGLAPASQALLDGLNKQPHSHATLVHFPTDHSYSDHRIALESAVLDWLSTIH